MVGLVFNQPLRVWIVLDFLIVILRFHHKSFCGVHELSQLTPPGSIYPFPLERREVVESFRVCEKWKELEFTVDYNRMCSAISFLFYFLSAVRPPLSSSSYNIVVC